MALTGRTLTVSGEHVEQLGGKQETLQRTFSRQFSLPEDIKLNTLMASFNKGTLEITVSLFIKIPNLNMNSREDELCGRNQK